MMKVKQKSSVSDKRPQIGIDHAKQSLTKFSTHRPAPVDNILLGARDQRVLFLWLGFICLDKLRNFDPGDNGAPMAPCKTPPSVFCRLVVILVCDFFKGIEAGPSLSVFIVVVVY